MKRYFKIPIIVLGLFCLMILVYALGVVCKARLETPGILSRALLQRKIVLKTKNLSRWQIHALLAVEDPNFYHHNGIDLKTP